MITLMFLTSLRKNNIIKHIIFCNYYIITNYIYTKLYTIKWYHFSLISLAKIEKCDESVGKVCRNTHHLSVIRV